ncbi:ATP-binding cassette sub-family G member 1-like [Cimex lectularius]|uniref:ABC transporter domain-containing protein n=1 Tax=Cimex lectularius TaxID=79782 RepID=A0A8I6RQ30_CIMLE|nr:ATP-binding cassette sub-family G member 1-like [Cimex lectularius]XP_014247503.1 ATP-binding cassette sub-family G member 1-like [Cimex lectularius]XP_014247504.1 ATP-binding cassette sub-family G member 1-like [Cimex lectularius]
MRELDDKRDLLSNGFNMEHFPRRPPVNIAFKDLSYQVLVWNKMKPGKKIILRNLTGEFQSGELTAIMGPSGAGKSTLLNVLAGFVVRGSSGEILINGVDRGKIGLEEFKKVSTYIQQDDVVRPLLTVHEAMAIATHLKLGCSITNSDKNNKIAELLNMLGLSQDAETLAGKLSGGQKKRLSIALELITNPPVIFLDEPTTGLDSSSTSSCVKLMRQLSRQGRTIVCTIHQPSALLFEQFNHVYCMSEGVNIYQGSPAAMLTYMANFGLICPPYHNPADFMIEVASGDYPRDLEQMAETSTSSFQQLSLVESADKVIDGEKGLDIYKRSSKRAKADGSDSDLGSVRCLPKPASAWLQLFHLYNRNIIVLKRDIMHIVLRFVAHLFISIVFGYLYQEVGNNAETLLANFIFVYGSILFLHYTGQMTVLLSFPLEYKVLTREHFNRWYSLPSYFLALLLVELPFQAACAMLYLIPGYWLTSQPLEWPRFGTYVMFNLAISLTAQATGFLAGALLPITIAVFLAPVFSVFFSVFGFTSRYQDIPTPLRPFYNISYFRSALQGSFLSLYGNGRDELPCYEIYCHYKKPQIFLKDMGFSDFQTGPEICYIIFIGLLSYALTVLSIWFKLNKR